MFKVTCSTPISTLLRNGFVITLPKTGMFNLKLLFNYSYINEETIPSFNRSFTMLKGEVLPHLVRKQFIKAPMKKNERELPNADVSVVSLNTTNRGT